MPASARPQEVPTQIRDLQLKSYEGKPQMVMRQAVCNGDINEGLITSLQQRLYDSGLAVGSITFETLDTLGIHRK